MALRGDAQGGSAQQGILRGMQPEVAGLAAGDGRLPIEKYMRWSIGFFVGAIIVFGVGLGTALYWLKNFTFSPATFFFETFLIVFGVIMLILDTPLPDMQKHPEVERVRRQIFKYALFMTRFMGRGIWYLFLSTLVFVALWDQKVGKVLGALCTIYLATLGTVAAGKGFLLSHKLNKVRTHMREANYHPERYVPQGQMGLSAEQFRVMVGQVTDVESYFSMDEIEYIINALSFSAFPDREINLEELQNWLQPGLPVMV